MRVPLSNRRQRQIGTVASILEERYGPRPWREHPSALDELVLTILSQHTSDVNSERAFAALKSRFPSWESIIDAPISAIAEAIRGGGLAKQKAPKIQGALREVMAQTGGDLDFLTHFSVAEGRKWLVSLPGVGAKTASCVLLFALGLPAMPVDTHVHRVAGRIGLIGLHDSPKQAQDILEAEVGANRDQIYALHMNLIAHGRAVCIARRPRCGECPLTRCCDYYVRLSANA